MCEHVKGKGVELRLAPRPGRLRSLVRCLIVSLQSKEQRRRRPSASVEERPMWFEI